VLFGIGLILQKPDTLTTQGCRMKLAWCGWV
jgi:hypothetical protein